ncbi:MAG: hypothetical protein U9O91_03395 [Candidatus Caldatribacteriota bacterium]|nr:hypothetical protein [Candidatus Caldatribacteriota bacterium]
MKQISLPADQQLRRRLGIPDDAERVLIFSESSHWDPNWLLTSEEYFERFVRHNLDRAIEELHQESRRVYSIECMFFLRLYWDRSPAQRDNIRELVNEGRLRLTSSGVTTADTLLPSAEAILRDLLIGQEWLRANGMEQEPKLAYFTDSFGCTPTLPSLLKAAGFDRTAITRVDGMYFMGCDLESSKRFPRSGSSAERLLTKEHSLDFVWRDHNGAQVLCHWNAFTYGQGDMLAFVGLSRVYLARVAFPARSEGHIAHRIKQYVARLSPYSRTPYMLCPIGFDFVEPIPDLVALLDRYNQNHYSTTGVWAVNAGMDDYLTLIESYQDKLPVLELDPNPYWTGFYTARPTLKRRCRKLVDNLLLAEKLSFLPENRKAYKTISQDLKDAWWQAAVSNHHDFITGTSPDKVVAEEQIPWLIQAADSVDAIIDRFTFALPVSDVTATCSKSLTWSGKNSRIQIKTAYYDIELAEDVGGAVVNLQSQDAQIPLLTGISNDLVSYRDSGGLWRMGFEFAGGIWKESMRASHQQIQMQVHKHNNGLEIISNAELNGETLRRLMWFSNDSPVIYCRIEGKAAEGHSVTVRFATGISSKNLVMDTPGGIVVRPPKRIYDPTFWPLHHFVHLQDDDTGRGLAILQPMPGAISYQPGGQLELVVMRNATREKVFGLIGIPGNPASGHERESYAFEYAFLFTQNGDWRDNNIHLMARGIANNPWSDSRDTALRGLADSVITTDSTDVWVTAIKPASRGEGVVVRLYTPVLPESPVVVTAPHFKVIRAFLCDARERDLETLEMQDGTVRVAMPGTVATIRLLIG